MNIKQYEEFHENMCRQARELSVQKNHDYTGGTDTPDTMAIFKNFLRVEQLGICTTETGFLTRLTDKFCRMSNLLRPDHKQAVKDESINDTAIDIINYVILLMAYHKAKNDMVCDE